jgi:glycosyltransferase involved in cell wall biosynthesis
MNLANSSSSLAGLSDSGKSSPVTPRVSVVMAVYNASEFLREAVESVLNQTYRDFELIVVDDASRDDSLAIIEGFTDPRIHIIRHSTNIGAALSRNDALATARGDLIAIMDADDVAAPTRLEKQVAFLDVHLDIGVVGCGVYNSVDTTGAVLCTSFLPTDNETLQRTLMERWCFLHPSITFRKSLYESVGGYRKAFEPAEDHDLLLRMLEHTKASNLNECLMRYRVNPRGLSVLGQAYINELGEIAMRLARRRRVGQPEELEAEMAHIAALKQKRNQLKGLASAVQQWQDSLYAASRFYGFGCRELCAGRLKSARRCFVQSLRTNMLFVKAWGGMVLSLMPFAARRLRFVFRSSMRQLDYQSWLRPVIDVDATLAERK